MEPHHAPSTVEPADVHICMPGYPPLGVTARAVVDRVVDGDTVNVELRWPVSVRLKDCWAPEPHGEDKAKGLEAKRHLEKLAPVGSSVVVGIQSKSANALGDLMSFGRVVANVWRVGDQESLSQIMVGAGFATEAKS